MFLWLLKIRMVNHIPTRGCGFRLPPLSFLKIIFFIGCSSRPEILGPSLTTSLAQSRKKKFFTKIFSYFLGMALLGKGVAKNETSRIFPVILGQNYTKPLESQLFIIGIIFLCNTFASLPNYEPKIEILRYCAIITKYGVIKKVTVSKKISPKLFLLCLAIIVQSLNTFL